MGLAAIACNATVVYSLTNFTGYLKADLSQIARFLAKNNLGLYVG